LSNTQIYHRSPKKFQMSENPRVRQIAQAIWTFGYAERPEGVRKAPRLLESLIAQAIWTFGCAERPEGVKKAQRLLESIPSGPPFVFAVKALSPVFILYISKYIPKNIV